MTDFTRSPLSIGDMIRSSIAIQTKCNRKGLLWWTQPRFSLINHRTTHSNLSHRWLRTKYSPTTPLFPKPSATNTSCSGAGMQSCSRATDVATAAKAKHRLTAPIPRGSEWSRNVLGRGVKTWASFSDPSPESGSAQARGQLWSLWVFQGTLTLAGISSCYQISLLHRLGGLSTEPRAEICFLPSAGLLQAMGRAEGQESPLLCSCCR